MSQTRGFEAHLKGCGAIAALAGPPWSIAVALGEDEHLIYRASRAFRSRFAADRQAETQLVDATAIDPEWIRAHFEERGLFSTLRPLIVMNADRSLPVVTEIVGRADGKGYLSQPVLLCCAVERLPAKIGPALKPLQKVEVFCGRLGAFEAPHVVAAMAEEMGLRLTADGHKFLTEALGMNAQTIENELRTLALHFAGEEKPLGRDHIKDHVGVLREDHVFKLSDMQRRGQAGAACLLVESLVERGEAPLAVLGLLARNVRSALRVADGLERHIPPGQVAEDLQIPPAAARELIALARSLGSAKLARMLRAAIAADLSLKSGGGDETNALASVLLP